MLKERIKKLIKEQGAIPFDKFMSLAAHNYYANSNPIGSSGDFITAPEISQVFGELIGLWLLDTWLKLGSPDRCHLIELGAGRGTLMADILRVAKSCPQFHNSLKIAILEINKELISIQKETLQDYKNISWVGTVEDLHIEYPVLIYSNEFFDALPVKQYLVKNEDVFELCVDIDTENRLKLVFVKAAIPMLAGNDEEKIIETSPVANSIFNYLAEFVSRYGGVFLTIDYGYEKPEFRNTIRGYKNHEFLSIFEIINLCGEVDWTYNVNFKELIDSLGDLSIDKYAIITQKEFLESLGLHSRVDILLKNIAAEKDKEDFLKGIQKLILPKEMGEKFKILCVSKNIPDLAVFKQ
ncbi:MAG: SAM-dependent methyltransferase [Alphaproteobacteria bacterium]|nr:SAM-dependent methyltransferase [Alphaproteobacteria bacterium]